MKKLAGIIIGALLILSSGLAVAQTETITSYSPSPEGDFQSLKSTGQTLLATDGASNVGIGLASGSTPQAKLEVYGGIKLGTAPNNGCVNGTLRYNGSALQICQGSWGSVADGAMKNLGDEIAGGNDNKNSVTVTLNDTTKEHLKVHIYFPRGDSSNTTKNLLLRFNSDSTNSYTYFIARTVTEAGILKTYPDEANATAPFMRIGHIANGVITPAIGFYDLEIINLLGQPKVVVGNGYLDQGSAGNRHSYAVRGQWANGGVGNPKITSVTVLTDPSGTLDKNTRVTVWGY